MTTQRNSAIRAKAWVADFFHNFAIISHYIYTGFQEGSIMKGWTKNENEMIACCSDGTGPVVFKIERIDYE